MLSDPPVRADGRCACGCGRKLPRSKQVRKYAGGQIDSDPFATTDCCRAWHGCPRRTYSNSAEAEAARAESGRASAERFRVSQRMDTL